MATLEFYFRLGGRPTYLGFYTPCDCLNTCGVLCSFRNGLPMAAKNFIGHSRTDYEDSEFTDSGGRFAAGDDMGRPDRHFIDSQQK